MVEPWPRGRNPFDESGVERGADRVARIDADGLSVGAVIVPLAGGEIELEAVLVHARAHLADFKVPQYVALREEPLPRNPGGKVLEAQLREQTSWGKALR
jgi:acyl-CoA synthetase (AMP-forming)/AMP-acid ligase II